MDPDLVAALEGALALEVEYQPRLQGAGRGAGEVTLGIRDGSAHVLRCLKVWYDLPSEVLFRALNLMDRFLTKMRALPKHMACIAASAFHLAAGELAPEPHDLLAISQSRCSAGDLARMQAIMVAKLGGPPSVTALTFLRLLQALLGLWGPPPVRLLEVVACDSACADFRPSEVALALLCPQQPETSVCAQLRQLCDISEMSLEACRAAVCGVLSRYDAQCHTPHRQRLIWKVSQRTLRLLRPTEKLTSRLPTIREQTRRLRCGSLSSDDGTDVD